MEKEFKGTKFIAAFTALVLIVGFGAAIVLAFILAILKGLGCF